MWATLWIAVGSVAAFGTLVLTAMLRITSHISRQNERQLQMQTEQKERDSMFRLDWYGQPARPGVPSSPGVMERLSTIEHNTSSLPDRVAQTERDLTIGRHRMELLEKKFEEHTRTHSGGGAGS